MNESNESVVCYFNGSFVPLREAKVGVMTHAFNYGTGCFEGIRAYWSAEQGELYVFRMREHYERLRRSAHVLLMDLPHPVDELCQITLELLHRNQFQTDVYIRPLVYKASEVIGVRLHDLETGFVIYAVPFGDYIEAAGGSRTMVSSWRRIDDNAAPARAKLTGIYVNSAFAKSEAALNGFDEAIMLTDDGHVSEGSAENLFIVVDGQVVTPPTSENILVGITRDTVIRLAREELGLPVLERSIDRSELYGADEIFLCGTGAQIVPVVEVDRRRIADGEIGPVTRRLNDLYMDVVHGRSERYREWLAPVYAGRAER
ncbi:MAG: branched-chain amino acid transaminase [Thermomicrobiaceae bacterium]|nr:branched-chain amino acid transaminase [Thermomicrobiaceae bacterium]